MTNTEELTAVRVRTRRNVNPPGRPQHHRLAETIPVVRLTIRLPASLREHLTRQAQQRGVTLSAFVRDRLADG